MTCRVKKDEGARVQKRINTQCSLAQEEKEVINILTCPKKKKKEEEKATYTSILLITNYAIMSLGSWNKGGDDFGSPGWVRDGWADAAGRWCWTVSWGKRGA